MKRIGKAQLASGAVAALAVFFLMASPAAFAEDGSSDCLACHENLGKAFETTVHGKLKQFEVLGGATGCVTCHGDGAQHMESGDPVDIGTFGAESNTGGGGGHLSDLSQVRLSA